MAKVTLISYTPYPEKVVASAAKLCYSSSSIDKISDSLTDEKIAGFVNMLSDIGHESPMEHVSFTFGIEGVSRALLAQITRHRIASYSVKSQRYVNETTFEYIMPPAIAGCKEAEEEFRLAMNEDKKHYDKISFILHEKYKKEFLESGIEEKKADRMAQKKAIEDARFVLPNACETKMVCTFNARSLNNFFAHRLCNRAQWEIREVAISMLKLVFEVAPNIFANSGPSCIKGKCPEGNMSCGEINQVRDFFKSLKGKDK